MMRIVIYSLIGLFLVACKSDSSQAVNLNYPTTKKNDSVVDDYHGTSISDPFRWLEDDHSDETKAWVKSQNEVTFDYLESIEFRDVFKDRLSELWNYEKYSVPFEEAGNYYQYKNNGLQNQSVLYQLNLENKDVNEVLDPNKFSEDGTSSLGAVSFDKTGKFLAYQISEGGSDWRTIKVKNQESGELLEDEVNWVKFSGISWYKDGFFYSRYPEPAENDELSAANSNHALYYHKLGDKQSQDELIYKDPDNPNVNVYATVANDESYLILSTVESTSGNALAVKDLNNPNSNIRFIVKSYDSDYQYVGNKASEFYFQTNKNASNWRVLKMDLNSNQPFESLIPEAENTIRAVSKIGDKLFVSYIKDASSLVKVFDLSGEFINNLELPGIGTIGSLDANEAGDLGFYSFSSFTTPTTIYRFDPNTLKSEVYSKPNIKFPVEDYVTKQVWFDSKDGTKVPMFITHKKGLKMDGKRPCLLYGYGGFDISILPSFSVTRLPILENDGIYAVANIRGGGEFGKAWHKSGTLDQKQNVFDDFQAAAEYLIKEDYTSSDKLAIEGRSNGGLLVGACMTQRPDLYAVAFPHVGVLDMLRYHEFTIGWAWATDYGRSDDKEAFEYLIKYSPLHNVKETEYPATMVTTADHDDRVVPAHSFKFISELQSKHQGDNPVLIRIETSAGHGAGKPVSKRIEESADILAFMFQNINSPVEYFKQ